MRDLAFLLGLLLALLGLGYAASRTRRLPPEPEDDVQPWGPRVVRLVRRAVR